MSLVEQIEALIGPTIGAMGFDIVRVQLSGNKRQRLQVMAEPCGGGTITVDDCARVSRAIAAVLEVEDPIPGAYTLEVSSPGIDRPLVRLGDFERYAGFEARVETGRPIHGRKRFRGCLLGVDGDAVRLRVEDASVALPYADIIRAKLVLTDALLAAGGNRTGAKQADVQQER